MSDITVSYSIQQNGHTVTERATLANAFAAVSFLTRAVSDMACVLTEDELAVMPSGDDILSCVRTFEYADGTSEEIVVV